MLYTVVNIHKLPGCVVCSWVDYLVSRNGLLFVTATAAS